MVGKSFLRDEICKDLGLCRSYYKQGSKFATKMFMVFTIAVNQIRAFSSGITALVFPNVCVCCGLETTEKDRQLCSFCKEDRFVDANPGNSTTSGNVLLPEIVSMQHALWQFDKGGALQDLMHYLKYERLTGIGYEIGSMMAYRALQHPGLKFFFDEQQSVLVPVPLHYLKFRKRGFNQAFFIAKGLKSKLGIPICGIDSVIRKKNTRTQTGFTIKKRIANIKDAFQVKNKEVFKNKRAIIIDDVFTTGSTTFELAKTLREAGAKEIIILTAAQA